MLISALLVAAALEPTVNLSSCSLRTPANEAISSSMLPNEGFVVQQAPVAGKAKIVTLFRLAGGTTKFPVAVGFCNDTTASPAQAMSPTFVGNTEPLDLSLLDPARWAASKCTLVTAGGRSARIDYLPYTGNRATFISLNGWPWKRRLAVARGPHKVDRERVRITKIGGRRSISATEYFYIRGANAANVILFDRLGSTVGPDETAVAICGYAGISRAPSNQ